MVALPPGRRFRPITGIDIAASVLSRLTPAGLEPRIDQARRDANAVLDGWLGRAERSFRSAEHPTRAPRPLASIDPIAETLPRGLAERYEALKRDLQVVARSLKGEHPPPLVARRPTAVPRAASAATAQPSTMRRMRITAIVRETSDTITLHLQDVTCEKVRFEAGQFLSVRADVNGETLWRAYSLCTAPDSGELAITIKRAPFGRVSNHLHERAAVGDVLEVRGPSGRFTLPTARVARHVVLLGGGSGITPLMSHARHVLSSEPETRVTLLYGSRSERDIIFREALSALTQAHGPRFVVRHVLGTPSEGFACGVGLLDAQTMERELAQLGVRDDPRTVYLMCGPEPMMKAAHEALARRSVASERILEERFSSAAPSEAKREADLREELVQVRIEGRESQVRVKPGQTILEAALAHSLPLDFSCTMGGCGACLVQLTHGTVHMTEPNCLSSAERGAGKVLACIARPTSPCKVEKT